MTILQLVVNPDVEIHFTLKGDKVYVTHKQLSNKGFSTISGQPELEFDADWLAASLYANSDVVVDTSNGILVICDTSVNLATTDSYVHCYTTTTMPAIELKAHVVGWLRAHGIDV